MTAQVQQQGADGAPDRRRIRVIDPDMQSLDRRMDNARECASWLIDLGVKVRGVEVGTRSAVVKVECSPLVGRLFAGRCAWRKRRQVGAWAIYTWFAVRNGARIEWEERQCAA